MRWAKTSQIPNLRICKPNLFRTLVKNKQKQNDFILPNKSKLNFVPKINFLYNIPIRRYYASDTMVKDLFVKNKVSRVSVYEPRTDELITAVKEGNYTKAEIMVLKEKVDVNGHNTGENTALTNAAKRGDCSAIEFLITKLKANPHASCDCPHHKTALHYASEYSHLEAVKLLLKLGANPHITDSRNIKAIDLAKNDDIKKILAEASQSSNMLGLKKPQIQLPIRV